MDNGWILIALIFGLIYAYVWYEDYDKRRKSEEQEQSDRVQRRREQDRVQAANEATLRAALKHRSLTAAKSDERNIKELFHTIGTEPGEAWHTCPTLEPLHRHWWGLVDASSLEVSNTEQQRNTIALTEEEFRELFSEVGSEVPEAEWTLQDVCDALDLIGWPEEHDSDDEQVVEVGAGEFRQALDAAISLLAERRPNDAELIRRALSGDADAPGYFCAAEELEALRESVGIFAGDRSPEHAEPPFSYLT